MWKCGDFFTKKFFNKTKNNFIYIFLYSHIPHILTNIYIMRSNPYFIAFPDVVTCGDICGGKSSSPHISM